MPLEDLIISQRLSRELENYRQPSPPARAATQLVKNGRVLRAGQRVRFLYTLGEPGVYAWDLPERPKTEMIDIERYSKLMLRAAHAVLEPFGYDEAQVAEQIGEIPAHQLRLPLPRRFRSSPSDRNLVFLQPSTNTMVVP
jgi:DNA polymerase elongation subunit (family B)